MNNNHKFKIIVAHPAQQHSLRTAVALEKKGILFKYITTVYYKKNSYLIKLIKIFINKSNKNRATNRKISDLKDSNVKQFYQVRGLIELLLIRYSKKLYHKWSKKTAYLFGMRVAKYAIKYDVDAVILYDTKAFSCFSYLQKHKPSIIRVLDMSAPNVKTMNDYVERYLNKSKNSISINTAKLPKYIERIASQEISLANYYLVASSFTKLSVEAEVYNKNRILLCSYGLDYDKYIYKPKLFNVNSKIKLLYVGRITSLKGVDFLFKAVEDLDMSNLSLSLVGDYNIEKNFYHEHSEKYNFMGQVDMQSMQDIYHEHHILIVPSLADGYGFVVLEAMFFGLIVICSKNTGSSDIITNGVDGFIVDSGSSDQIKNIILNIENNHELLKKISENAHIKAKSMNWANYYECVGEKIKDVLYEQYK